MSDSGSARRLVAGRTAIALGVGCALAACAVLAYAAYELWGTGGTERAAQAELAAAYESATSETSSEAATADQLVDEALATTTTTAAQSTPVADETAGREPLPGGVDPDIAERQFPTEGRALARLEIPSIEVDKFVMRDVDEVSLQAGPGHYAGTVRPGYAGNAAIAGHRTTYGAPFGRVDELEPGDQIIVHSADGRFTYEVLEPAVAFGDRIDDVNRAEGGHVVVDPDDTWVVGEFGDARLTLTSCHPEFTSRDRIVVVAQLVSEVVPWGDVFGGRSDAELRELVSEDLSEIDA